MTLPSHSILRAPVARCCGRCVAGRASSLHSSAYQSWRRALPAPMTEQYGECVPPVEKLWDALRHGDPFPTCDFGAGGSQGTSGVNIFASAGYCREDLLYWGGHEQSELLCNARGAINVEIDGALYTRVWWDARGADRTITEFYGGGTTQVSYDPTQSARLFLEREYESSGGQGGGE
jgi:hypothetical protein